MGKIKGTTTGLSRADGHSQWPPVWPCAAQPDLLGLRSKSEFLLLLCAGKNLLCRELLWSVTSRCSGNRWLSAFLTAREPPAPPHYFLWESWCTINFWSLIGGQQKNGFGRSLHNSLGILVCIFLLSLIQINLWHNLIQEMKRPDDIVLE